MKNRLNDTEVKFTRDKNGYDYLYNPYVDKWVRFDKFVYVQFNRENMIKSGLRDMDEFDLIHLDGDNSNNTLDNLKLVVVK